MYLLRHFAEYYVCDDARIFEVAIELKIQLKGLIK
jgi:hypothetical protein